MISRKNHKLFALILLTSALLLTIGANIAFVKAQTQDSVLTFTTLGGTIAANGSTLTGGTTKYNDASTISFSATASTGFQFLCWEYADASGATTSTTNALSYTIKGDIAIEAIFIPTTHTTPTITGSGSASVELFSSIGGTTSPAGSASGTPITGYIIGATSTFTQTPGDGFKFLCWISQNTAGVATLSEDSPFSLNITDANVALQALWIPTSSSVTIPHTSPSPSATVPEFSSATVAILAAALVVVAVGAYAFKKTKQ